MKDSKETESFIFASTASLSKGQNLLQNGGHLGPQELAPIVSQVEMADETGNTRGLETQGLHAENHRVN